MDWQFILTVLLVVAAAGYLMRRARAFAPRKNGKASPTPPPVCPGCGTQGAHCELNTPGCPNAYPEKETG